MMQAGRALRFGMVRIPFVSSLATKARAFASVGSVEKALFGPESADISRGHDMFRKVSGDGESVHSLAGGRGGEEFVVSGEGIVYLRIGKGVVLT